MTNDMKPYPVKLRKWLLSVTGDVAFTAIMATITPTGAEG
jgi:hypothetical protein